MSTHPTVDDSTSEYLKSAGTETRQVSVEFGARTHPGKVRENNEDQFLVSRMSKSLEVMKSSLSDSGTRVYSEDVGYLLAVADGMGGAAAGEQASALAVSTVEDFALNTLKWFFRLGQGEEHSLLAELRAGLELADRAVIDRGRETPGLHGMGTTLTMAYSVGTDLYVVHAGDTRAYLFHNGDLQQVTNDHTLVQLLVSQGVISAEDAKRHKRRNVVTNVVGGPGPGVHAEVHKITIDDGDVLLLCSDGLTQPVGDAAIGEILGANSDPDAACSELIERALALGAPDNVTVVVARYRIC